MPDNDACLLDTNILLRSSKSDDTHYAVIGRALRSLLGQRVRLCYTSQTLGEFWNASTRPVDKNGFGLSVAYPEPWPRVWTASTRARRLATPAVYRVSLTAKATASSSQSCQTPSGSWDAAVMV